MQLTEEEECSVRSLLKKKSRFVWTDDKCGNTIRMLNQIRDGTIKLSEMVPGLRISYADYLLERDLLKFVT